MCVRVCVRARGRVHRRHICSKTIYYDTAQITHLPNTEANAIFVIQMIRDLFAVQATLPFSEVDRYRPYLVSARYLS